MTISTRSPRTTRQYLRETRSWIFARAAVRARAPSPAGSVEVEGFSSYWPGIADDPANRALSEDHRELSRIYNRLPKVVVSDSYTPPPENPWYDITTVVRRGEYGAAGR